VRLDGPTLPRSAAPSTSRTARASTGMTPTSSLPRERRWDERPDALRWTGLRVAFPDCPWVALPRDWPERAMILLVWNTGHHVVEVTAPHPWGCALRVSSTGAYRQTHSRDGESN